MDLYQSRGVFLFKKNYILKRGQILFREGEKSNGMFVVRKGELEVYITQGHREVELASVSAGGMIGEMALFDQKPRSASVRARLETEVSHITVEDFIQLKKQIPTWFVGLMSTLSGRLRSTNDKLQKIEIRQLKRYKGTLRILNAFAVLWQIHGVKEGKVITVEKAAVLDSLGKMLPDDGDFFENVFIALERLQIISIQKTGRGTVFAANSRVALLKFTEYLSKFVLRKPGLKCLDDDQLNILKTLAIEIQLSLLDQFQIGFTELRAAGIRQKYNIDNWMNAIMIFDEFDETIQLARNSDGQMAIKTHKSTLKDICEFQKAIRLLADMHLD